MMKINDTSEINVGIGDPVTLPLCKLRNRNWTNNWTQTEPITIGYYKSLHGDFVKLQTEKKIPFYVFFSGFIQTKT